MEEHIKFWPLTKEYYKKTIPFSICKCFPFVTTLFSFFLISLYKDKHMTVGFGLSTQFYNALNYQLTLINSDTAAIFMTKYLGMGLFKSLNITYYNGIITNGIIFLFSIIFYVRLDLIIVMMGFDPISSGIMLKNMFAMFPFLLVQVYSESLRNFLITMGFDMTINVLNGLQIIVMVPLAWFFMVYLNLQGVGYGIFKLINEQLIIAFLLFAWKRNSKDSKLDKKKQGSAKENFQESFSRNNKQFKEYFIFFLKSVPGTYGEYLSYECITFICGFYGNINVTASWMSIQPIMSFAAGIGNGCGSTTRNFVGEALGMGQNIYAKKLASYCLVYSLFMGLIQSAFYIIFADEVTSQLTKEDPVKIVLKQFCVLYSFNAFLAVIWSTLNSLMRMIDRIFALAINSFINMQIIQITIVAVGLWVLDWGGNSIFQGYTYGMYSAGSIQILIIFYQTDWSKIKKMKDIETLDADFDTCNIDTKNMNILSEKTALIQTTEYSNNILRLEIKTLYDLDYATDTP